MAATAFGRSARCGVGFPRDLGTSSAEGLARAPEPRSTTRFNDRYGRAPSQLPSLGVSNVVTRAIACAWLTFNRLS